MKKHRKEIERLRDKLEEWAEEMQLEAERWAKNRRKDISQVLFEIVDKLGASSVVLADKQWTAESKKRS